MKNYESFDNTFFTKIICIIAALALVFIVAIATISLFTKDYSLPSKDSDAETFIFGEPEGTSLENSDVDTGIDTADVPPETDSESDSDTEALSFDTEAVTETEAITEENTKEPHPAPAPPKTVLEETEDMGEGYIDSMIFLGDSTTYGLKAYKMLKDGKNTNQVWTTTTATLSLSEILTKKIVYPKTKEEMLIADAAALAVPEYLVITLGVEGITFLDEKSFKEQYSSLVNAIKTVSPQTKIILQSIFPVSSELKKLNNSLIDNGNIWIKEIAESTGVRYLDTCTVLKDENGALNPKYDNGGNGINLNDTGFTAVLNYIRTHGYK